MVARRLLGGQWMAIAFVGGVSFILSVIIARRFGPEAFGVYAQAISLGTLLMIVVDGGFGKLLMRETGRASSPLTEHCENLHSFAFGHACMAITFLAIAVVLNPVGMHRPTLLATVGAFGAAVVSQFSWPSSVVRGA